MTYVAIPPGGSTVIADPQGGPSANVTNVGGTGALAVNVVQTVGGGGGGGGASQADESTFTAGTTTFTPIGGVFNDSIGSPASGQAASARITSFRAIHINLRNNSGTEIGTSGNPVRTDPTGTTTQPVSISAALPTGSNTIGAVTQASGPWTTNLTQVGGAAIALGQAAMAASLPVAIASNQSTLNVAVASALPTGANTIGAVTQASGPWTTNVTQIGGSALAFGQAAMASSIPVAIASNQSTLNVTVATALPTGSNTIGAVTQASGPWTDNLIQVGGSSITLGQKASAASLPVVLASDQGAITVSSGVNTSATATLSNVSASATSVVLLSSNSNRKGATIFNDSTVNAYVKFGTTASTSSFTIKMGPAGYFELPETAVYTGEMDVISDSATGTLRVTELT